MNESLSKMMGNKVWKTVTEDNLRRSAAAWRWLEAIASGNVLASNIDAALFSRWFTSEILIQQNEDAVVASLGNYSWGVLMLPLKEYVEGGVTYYVVDSEASPTMTHVTNPNVWKLCCMPFSSFAPEDVPTLVHFLDLNLTGTFVSGPSTRV